MVVVEPAVESPITRSATEKVPFANTVIDEAPSAPRTSKSPVRVRDPLMPTSMSTEASSVLVVLVVILPAVSVASSETVTVKDVRSSLAIVASPSASVLLAPADSATDSAASAETSPAVSVMPPVAAEEPATLTVTAAASSASISPNSLSPTVTVELSLYAVTVTASTSLTVTSVTASLP